MANDVAENKGTVTNESFNQAVELKKSFNVAVPLAQTIAQPQSSGPASAAAPAQSTNSSNNE